MSSKQELLLAAKAVGYKIDGYVEKVGFYHLDGIIISGRLWNPLVNNEDAFQLALALGISVEVDASIETGTFTVQGVTEGEYALGIEAWHVRQDGTVIKSEQVYTGNKAESARRVIVDVAVQLGKLK